MLIKRLSEIEQYLLNNPAVLTPACHRHATGILPKNENAGSQLGVNAVPPSPASPAKTDKSISSYVQSLKENINIGAQNAGSERDIEFEKNGGFAGDSGSAPIPLEGGRFLERF